MRMRKLVVVALSQRQKDELLALLEAQTDPDDLPVVGVIDQLYAFEANGVTKMEHESW